MSALHQVLANQASSVLATTGHKRFQAKPFPPLLPFVTGGLGNFPYYWQDPGNLSFNSTTYQWISANLKAGAYPLAQASGSTFNNLFIAALGKVYYSLSSQDLQKLQQSGQNVLDCQAQLLATWAMVFGSVPPPVGSKQSIDLVLETICDTWANPDTTLSALRNAPDILKLLNQVPASGEPILPNLVNYLNALNQNESLIRATTMETGYLNEALGAVQSPSKTNGGLLASDGLLYPAYQVSTPLAEILNGLNGLTNSYRLSFTVHALDGQQVRVEMAEGMTLEMPLDQLFTLADAKGCCLVEELLRKSKAPLRMEVTFDGLTLVEFGPVRFDESKKQYWFWNDPITDALKNGGRDVTGFHFGPSPGINFGEDGPFAFLDTVAISKYPTIQLTIPAAGKALAGTYDQMSGLEGRFMGVVLEDEKAGIIYTHDLVHGKEDGALLWVASPESGGGMLPIVPLDARAWVHGVHPVYPGAM